MRQKVVESEVLLSHLESLAAKHFSLSSLRPQQKNVFVALQSQRQVLAMLPTGAGKTLLYALGSLLFRESVTIVICPLIALMRDQQQRMVQAGISTATIFSEQSEDERRQAYRSLMQGNAKLLFVSPERFCLPSFQRLLRRLKLAMVVVDEAHCVVTWGHSFRPEYGQLASLLKQLDVPRILALTATASRQSRELIREMVFPEPASVFELVDKPLKDNIHVESLRVYSEDQRWQEVERIVRETKSTKSILYFPRREQCQKAAQELKRQGINAVVYHAGLPREMRKSVEEYLRESARPVVICATLAFGMGIDLPNVQLIIVVGFPGNLEEMFQMMGRAGRKGELSRAVIVWSGSDPKKRSFQFDKTMPEVGQMLSRMRRLSTLMPGEGQTRLMHKSRLLSLFASSFKQEKDVEQAVQSLVSVLSMLGRGGALESTRSDWIELKVPNPEMMVRLLAELPVGPSRRRMVLEWIQARFADASTQVGIRIDSFALNELCEDLQIAAPKVLEVLRYYSDKQQLTFDLIPTSQAVQSVLLSGDFENLQSLIPRYQRWRGALSSSLQALSAFVTAEQCRMVPAENFFLPRSGASRLQSSAFCGRCDLCASRSDKQTRALSGTIAAALTPNSSEHLR
jgi:RecQ family ATP-dependent DNA helicase